MKKGMMTMLLALVLIGALMASAYADVPSGLTWDGAPATLQQIAAKLGYDFYDAGGNYKPAYYLSAIELWKNSLMKGDGGVLNLDQPVTRVEGVIMILRLLGKEKEALDQKLECPFTDVPDWAKYYVSYAAANGITQGYSPTTFGTMDLMSANQYLTFVLRAMGYDDEKGDFTWDKAALKALEIGIIGEPCKEQYMRSNLFLRDNVAAITFNALYANGKDGTSFASKIAFERAEGKEPYATAAEKAAAEQTASNNTQTTTNPVVSAGESYPEFDVPSYANVDPEAKETQLSKKDDRVFYAYDRPNFRTKDYAALLKSMGFEYRGDMNFEPKNVVTVTGNIVTTTTQAWVCDWYGKGDLQVVFGQVGTAYIVRIYNGPIDKYDANSLRVFWMIMNKN